MASLQTRLLIVLAAALAFANAQCFARCLAQPPARASMPCHSHGQTHSSSQQHDLKMAAAHSVAPASGNRLVLLDTPVESARSLPEPLLAGPDPGPPPLPDTAAPLPLRI